MNKSLYYRILIIIIFFIFLIPNKSFGENLSNDYTIESYNINMIVNEDNTFDITENIIADFNVEKHGIYRKIPLRNSVIMSNTKSSNIAKITDIVVSESYTSYNRNGYKIIQIGDDSQTFIGEHSYTIKYKYNIGKDPLKNGDELYFNLIGNQWDTSVSSVFFTIIMPKPFDESHLDFSSGYLGSTDSSNVKYSVNGNTITGNIINPLNEGEALTVMLTLPEDYFVGESINIDIYSTIVVILCVFFVLIAYNLWLKYGKDNKVTETVECYPPNGYNSAEIGFLYDGVANSQSIISLLIYLANKGYLKIEETEERGPFINSIGFKITKIKEYDGNNEYEKIFFDGLFKNSNKIVNDVNETEEVIKEPKKYRSKMNQVYSEISSDNYNDNDKNSVTSSELFNNFYKTIDKIEARMNSKENKNKIFESSSTSKVNYLKLMIITLYLLITVKPIVEAGQFEYLIPALIFPRNRIYFICERSYENK